MLSKLCAPINDQWLITSANFCNERALFYTLVTIALYLLYRMALFMSIILPLL